MQGYRHGAYSEVYPASVQVQGGASPSPSPSPPPPEERAVTVTPVEGTLTKYDKRVDELQQDITINGKAISGTLKYATGITAFPENEQNGHFLVLALEADEGTIKTKILNGAHDEEITVDDGFCMYRITDKDQQQIQVRCDGVENGRTDVYTLDGLTCQGAP